MTFYVRIGKQDIVWAANTLPTSVEERADFVLPYSGGTDFARIKNRTGDDALYVLFRQLDSVFTVHSLTNTGIGLEFARLKITEIGEFLDRIQNEQQG